MQAAALKPADFFGNDDVLYLMEDMATGEIRLSILWEWLHKGRVHRGRRERREGGRQVHAGALRPAARRGVRQAARGGNRDVHDNSKKTTLPIAREIVETYVTRDRKLPWYIDLLNVNLNNVDLTEAKRRIRLLTEAFENKGARLTGNLDF